MPAKSTRTRTVEIRGVGRDSFGEPTASFWTSPKRGNYWELPSLMVVPITEAEHGYLMDAIAASERWTNHDVPVLFRMPGARVDMALGAQSLRETSDSEVF